MDRKDIEILSPAGDMERFYTAAAFGADAIYVGGRAFSMRAASKNFSFPELAQAARYAHDRGIRLYLACNTLPRNHELAQLPAFFEQARQAGADALILTDLGAMRLAQKYAPGLELHVSTQAGVVNYETANFFYSLGARRVVLARELSLSEIAEIRRNTPADLELEAFVHGSMCVSFSGRCLLSNYLTGRDANRGECAQPCRWKYRLVEETRPGEYFPVVEEPGNGAHILNSRDLCMIEHIPQLVEAGVTSFKIEGRAKSSYYVALTTHAYSRAVDAYFQNPEGFQTPKALVEELHKISHRDYSTGFFFGEEPGQVYENGGYIREYQVAGVVTGYEDGMVVLSQRNRFFKGDVLDVLEPGGEAFLMEAAEMYDEEGRELNAAPHAAMTVKIPYPRPVKPGALLRIAVQ